MGFQVSKEQHPTTGDLNGTVFLLQSEDSADCIRVWPALGFNCYQWQAGALRNGDPVDVLYADPQLFDNGRPTRSGIPILFPFPNRIRGGRFDWNGKQYQLPLTDSNKKNAAHGFVCRKPWRVTDEGKGATGAWITGEFQLSREDPESREHWPADFIFRVTYQLSKRQLRIVAEVENVDAAPLPFGLGYHPYFRAPLIPGGSGDNCAIQVPATSYWVLEDSIPTGERRPVDEARDLTKPRAFSAINVDDVLTDVQPSVLRGPDKLRWNGTAQEGEVKLQIFSSQCFRELVVFTPPHRAAFCIEPYTCPSNAINLQREQDVGWLSLEPAAKWTSVVELVI